MGFKFSFQLFGLDRTVFNPKLALALGTLGVASPSASYAAEKQAVLHLRGIVQNSVEVNLAAETLSFQTPTNPRFRKAREYYIQETTNYGGAYQIVLKKDGTVTADQDAGISVDGAALEFIDGQAVLGGLRRGADGLVHKRKQTIKIYGRPAISDAPQNYFLIIKTR